MLEQKFIDRIEELRHHTYSRITELQHNLCPMVKDVYMNYQFDYWYDGYKCNLWEDNMHVYAVKEIPYCYDNYLKNTTYMDTLDHLVAEDKVWPFLLFIDGVAIQWSKILIIHDYDYSYIKILDIAPDYSFHTKMVVFPIGSKSIRYGEDSDIMVTYDRKGLYFREGKLLESTDFVNDINIRLEILDKNVYFNTIDITKSGGYFNFKSLPDGYIPTLDNILLFNHDGLFNHNGPESKIKDLYHGTFGLFKILTDASSDQDAKTAILMYNTNSNTELNSLYDRMGDLDRDSIRDLILNNSNTKDDIWKKVIAPLISTFDFDHDYRKSYEENISDATKYITRYDFRLWERVFMDDMKLMSFCYTGEEFKRLTDNKGYAHFSRHHSNVIEDVVIVFVNHRLYQYMVDVNYVNNTINIPAFGIMDDDHVEILLFTHCNNQILDLTVTGPLDLTYVHPEYNPENSYLMSEECPDAVYDVPPNRDKRKQYIVDFTYEKKDDKYIIKFENDFYYNKPLKVVPKRQFRYYRFKYEEGQRNFILPTQFNYCHDRDRYLVFINGKKIDKTEYTITFMNKWRPFDKLVMYVSTLMDIGDYIDIFYVPEIIVEKYKQYSMPKTGLLMLEDSENNVNYPTTYPLTKNTVMLFINGLKVNPLDIKDINLNTVLVDVDDYKRIESGDIATDDYDDPIRNRHQVDSIDNITIVEFIPGSKEIGGYLKGLYEQIPEDESYDTSKIDFNQPASDDWKDMVKVLINGGIDGVDLKTIFGPYYTIFKPDESYKDNFANLRAILYDVIIDYYLDKVNTGEKFVYDFEREYFDGQAPDIETKLIPLFPDKDKLYNYIPVDLTAKPEDVMDKKTYLDALE